MSTIPLKYSTDALSTYNGTYDSLGHSLSRYFKILTDVIKNSSVSDKRKSQLFNVFSSYNFYEKKKNWFKYFFDFESSESFEDINSAIYSVW